MVSRQFHEPSAAPLAGLAACEPGLFFSAPFGLPSPIVFSLERNHIERGQTKGRCVQHKGRLVGAGDAPNRTAALQRRTAAL